MAPRPSVSSDEDDQKMCETCNIRPAHRNHRYCSKACAGETAPKADRRQQRKPLDEDDEANHTDEEDLSKQMSRMTVSAGSKIKVKLCSVCKEMPAHKSHPYCSKACKTKAETSKAGPSKQAAASKTYSDEEEEEEDTATEDDGGKRKHKKREDTETSMVLAKRPPMCMFCRRNPKIGNSAFCGRRCADDAVAALKPKGTIKKRRETWNYKNSYRESSGYRDDGSGYWDDGSGYSGAAPYSPPWSSNGYGPSTYSGWPGPTSGFAPGPNYPTPPQMFPQQQTFFNPTPWPMYPPPPVGPPCAIPGCKAMTYGPGSRYCGQSCRKDAVLKGLEAGCLYCKVFPKSFKKHYCSQTCGQTAERGAPMLLDLPPTDPKYAEIVKQFNATWTGGYGYRAGGYGYKAGGLAVGGLAAALMAPIPGNPTIKRICKVVNSKAVETRYQAYRKQVEARTNFAAQGKPEGNECRRWHGTQRTCTVGDTAANLTLCVATTCRLCSIIRVSFQTSSSVCQSSGIYTSAFSGVSDGYTRLPTAGSPYKAMFLTRIVVGKRHIGGYAPVAGTDSTAIDNIDSELIVFSNDAILPSWLVLYS